MQQRTHKVEHGKGTRGIFGPTRRAWVEVLNLSFITYIKAAAGNTAYRAESDSDIEMLITGPRGRQIAINLATMSTDELLALKHYMDVTLQAALAICQERDEFAARNEREIGQVHSRLFRPDPVVWVRDSTGVEPETMPTGWTGVEGNPTFERRITAAELPKQVPTNAEIEEDENSTYGINEPIQLDE